ncbi:MAG: hypothetical protein DRI89_07040 [Bacteroidetes bacterium]|nr:MAG: hypothetical protein DRI89_07040 [Bacteroidota bacterium]
MEDILTYVIVFGVIIGGVAIWQLRRSKARPYVLSTQNYPELQLRVIIQKQDGKTKDFLVQTTGLQELSVSSLFVELISKSRSFAKIDTGLIHKNLDLPILILQNQVIQFIYPFDSFKKYLQSSDFKFKSFRVVLEDGNGKKYKSHEMAFNKNWVIYRPDTGRYN